MTPVYRYLAVFLLTALLAACADQSPEQLRLAGPTMGTTYSVVLVDRQAIAAAEQLEQRIAAELERLEGLMSTYQPDSELSRFNRSEVGQWQRLSPETLEVLQLAQQVSAATSGAFDVTVGPLVRLWGFGPDARPHERPDDAEIETTRQLTGAHKLGLRDDAAVRRGPIDVDLSAIAKGYAADRIAGLLRAEAVSNFLVEVGGELRAVGNRGDGSPWRVAVEAPVVEDRKVHQVLRLSNHGVATSGDYRNYFEADGVRYSHTIDPRTGRPIRHRLASVTVAAATAAEADAYATALMVMGPERAEIFAVEHELAVFLIIRNEQGFQERASPLMQLLLEARDGY